MSTAKCRFESLLKERLGVEVFKEDELATVVHGVAFMLENSVDELYALEHSRCVTSPADVCARFGVPWLAFVVQVWGGKPDAAGHTKAG